MHLDKVYTWADGRFGLLTRSDLHRYELSDSQISRLVRTNSIIRVHRSVYRVPGAPATAELDALGACLAVGPDAVASHATAVRLWKVLELTGLPEVSVANGHRSRQSTLTVHRPRLLEPREVTRIGVIPVTRVARTLSDLARRLPANDLENALDDALRRRLVTPDQLAAYPRLRSLAEDRRGGIPGNDLERRAIKALREARLPEPTRQHEVTVRGPNYRIDLAYPDLMIAIELEGRAPHWGRDRWQSDHDRRRALEAAGWRVLPFTWHDVAAGTFVAEVGRALGLRPTRWSAR